MIKSKEKENAEKNLKELRNDLVNVADDIVIAGAEARKSPEELNEISKYVSHISGKVGVV